MFTPSECYTLRLVWVSIYFIDLSELDRRARNGGLQAWEYSEKKLFFRSQLCSFGRMERDPVPSPGLSRSPRKTRELLVRHV
jgi:hypothetical protein